MEEGPPRPRLPLPRDSNEHDDEQDAQRREVEAEFESRARENRSARERIGRVYRSVWDAFYGSVEREGCRSKLAELVGVEGVVGSLGGEGEGEDEEEEGWWVEAMDPGADADDMDVDMDMGSDEGQLGEGGNEEDTAPGPADTFACFDFATSRHTDLACSSILTMSHFDPYPKYEACAPASRSIDTRRPEASEASSIMDFIPYAGEAGFDEMRYVRKFRKPFAWQYMRNNDGQSKFPFPPLSPPPSRFPAKKKLRECGVLKVLGPS